MIEIIKKLFSKKRPGKRQTPHVFFCFCPRYNTLYYFVLFSLACKVCRIKCWAVFFVCASISSKITFHEKDYNFFVMIEYSGTLVYEGRWKGEKSVHWSQAQYIKSWTAANKKWKVERCLLIFGFVNKSKKMFIPLLLTPPLCCWDDNLIVFWSSNYETINTHFWSWI